MTVVVLLCVIIEVLVLGVAPASAAGGYNFSGSLGGPFALATPPAQFGGPEGEGAGQFSAPGGIAIEQASGDVYVVDRNNQRVEKFGREGEFLLAWGWGVAHVSSNGLQTCGPHATPPTSKCFAGLEGSAAGEFSYPEGVAVDNDPASPSHGDVYVVDTRNDRVEKFTPNGEFLLMLGGEVDKTTLANLCTAASGDKCGVGVEGPGPGQFVRLERHSIAVDSAGHLYVGDENRVQRFSSADALETQILLPGSGGVVENLAVDSAGGLYVQRSELPGVRKYDGTGTEIGVPRDESGRPGVIAIGPAGELFVDDFNVQHVFAYDTSGKQLSSLFEEGEGNGGLAFGEAAASLYVLHQTSVHVVSPAVPGRPYVIAASESATEVQPSTARLNATLNPENGAATTYRFEYGPTAAYGQSTPVVELTGGGFEDQAAGAALIKLQPRTVYHFRVLATNAAAETTTGPDQTFETLPPVSIDSTSASQVTATSARLETELNPHGLPTTYHFEYDTRPYAVGEAPHGASTAVAGAGSGGKDAAFSLLIQGLAPGVTYHYRVVAENELGRVEGEEQTFTTEGSSVSLLPDGRAWEMVSPPNKNGVPLEPISYDAGIIQAAADGSGLAYYARGAIDSEPAGNRSFANSQLLAHRGPSGWSTQDVSTAHQAPAGLQAVSEYALFSTDLSRAAVEPDGATPLSPAASERTPYLRRDYQAGTVDQPCTESCYEPLVSGCPEAGQPCRRAVEEHADVLPGTKFGGTEVNPEDFNERTEFQTGTPDLSHLLLRSPSVLTSPPFSIEEGGGQYTYEWSAGSLSLVSQIPVGAATVCGGAGPACVPVHAQIGEGSRSMRHAISAEGSRVIFEASSNSVTHLFMRDLSRGETVRLDVPQPGAAGGEEQPVFEDASVDGSKVFFADVGRLTSDSGGGRALYMCEVLVQAGHLVCELKNLSVDSHAGEHADVQGFDLGTSADASIVYFVANGKLAEGAVSGACSIGIPNPTITCNLYSVNTVTGAIKLVAVLSGLEANDWIGNFSGGANLAMQTARVSPNGRYLAFMSQRSLTGYDNRDARSGRPDQEVYLYDSETGKLRCASCNPTGARPVGIIDDESGSPPYLLVDRPALWQGQTLAGSIPGWTQRSEFHALYQSRYLSDSGRLFFNAADSLVPQDQNGTEDVYQYEPPKSEGAPPGDTCTAESPTYSPRSGGCVNLISSGSSGEESAFVDASESGNDVFFLTASRLAPQDEDNALDVYDAHVCSAEAPCPPPPGPAAPACEGDACQNPVAPPNDATPGSLTFHGPGNIAPIVSKHAPLTEAQKLRAALKACKKDKAKRKRAGCERQARTRYGVKSISRTKRVGRGGRSK